MPSERTHTPSSTDGPNLLEERSVGGVLVHFLAIPTGVVGAGLVYLVATNEFTKRNARNALDWHLSVLAITAMAFGSAFTYAELTGRGVTDVVTLPSSVSTVASLVVFASLSLWTLVPLSTVVVGFVATGKALFGTAWRYPLAPSLVDRVASRVDSPGGWPALLLVYVGVTPLVIWAVLAGPTDGAAFLLTAVGLLVVVTVSTPLTAVGMYLHGERDRSPDADWQPHVVAYVGVPVVLALLGYGLSMTFTDSINPGGDATYVLLAAFWASAVVYLVRWRTVSR